MIDASAVAAIPAPAADSALTPTTADRLQPPPAMTIEQAQAKKAELFGRPGFAQRVMAGDPESSKLWREVTRALRPPVDKSTIEGQQFAKNMDGLSILKAKADLPESAWAWAASKGPVSPAEKEAAIFAKARNFADASWKQRYFSGDRLANSEMTNINLILAARIGNFQDIEQHKVVVAKLLGTSK